MIKMKIYKDEELGEYVKITHSSYNYQDIHEEIVLRIPRFEFSQKLKEMMDEYNETMKGEKK